MPWAFRVGPWWSLRWTCVIVCPGVALPWLVPSYDLITKGRIRCISSFLPSLPPFLPSFFLFLIQQIGVTTCYVPGWAYWWFRGEWDLSLPSEGWQSSGVDRQVNMYRQLSTDIPPHQVTAGSSPLPPSFRSHFPLKYLEREISPSAAAGLHFPLSQVHPRPLVCCCSPLKVPPTQRVCVSRVNTPHLREHKISRQETT